MEIVLLERVEKLGQMGDVVNVKDGFARNYLLPQNKALRATKSNLEYFETQKAQIEAQSLERKTEADSVVDKLDGESFVILRQAGEAGQLFGSASTRDIAEVVTENGFTISRNQVILDHPIKMLGLHEVRVKLHAEVSATITLNVARSQDEAERQARGEDVNATNDDELDEEEALALAEEVFESDELAQEAADSLSDEEEAAAAEAAPAEVASDEETKEATE